MGSARVLTLRHGMVGATGVEICGTDKEREKSRETVGVEGEVFFLQAEDGIRDGTATGVQTCALPISDEVTHYAVEHGSWRPDDVARQLHDDTLALGDPAGMQIGDDQGQLLTMLTRLIGARRAVERSEERRGKEWRSRGSAWH